MNDGRMIRPQSVLNASQVVHMSSTLLPQAVDHLLSRFVEADGEATLKAIEEYKTLVR